MRIKDILKFNKDKYFGGAVQANWFYEADKVKAIADSYVFHGPKYHGVTGQELQNTSYKLNDTATYAMKLIKRTSETESSRFCMTIAGYGTGKSHLSVALASLLSGHDEELRQVVLKNISAADRSIGEEIKAYLHKNLVIVLNGMRDFNLNSEVLATAKKALAQHSLSADIFDELTTQYKQAISFCINTFDTHKARYEHYLADTGLSAPVTPEAITEALENADKTVFNAVNEVYKEFMGTYIHAESGVSAADVLSLIVKKYCIETPVFDRIYILFDEFGRYIEFTANNPSVAGDSSLQQIFEAVQNANGRIVFDAFIQNDLNSYIRRVENAGSNISRYVGRYENSEKFYLSSNFETILANLIEKKDEDSFESIVARNIDEVYAQFHKNTFMSLCRWAAPEINSRAVWVNERMYFDVIAKGCYPIHPITVWFLANTSSWMQQRSTIAYTAEMFEAIQDNDVSGRWLPYIYPVDIIGTSLFDEMLSSEEKGFVASQNCLTYQTIISKLNGKLNDNAVKVLRAILICNILKFDFYDRISALNCLRLCAGLTEEDTTAAVAELENEYCVITYDTEANRFDINAEAHGKQEYTICIMKKMTMLRGYDPIDELDEELSNELRLNIPVSTAFSQENNISSPEWQYDQILINISKINEMYCRSLMAKVKEATDGEMYRGILVYLYCGKTSERDIPIAAKLIKALELQKPPIVFCLLHDDEEKWFGLLKRRAVYRKFTESEKEMFYRFLGKESRAIIRTISSEFNRMTGERKILTDKGIETLSGRINQYCFEKFCKCYPNVIPFSFTEFEKKATPTARKMLLSMCRDMFTGIMCNKQSYQGLDPTEKRRIVTALHTTATSTSWQVFDANYSLCEPRNSKVKKIYQDVMEKFSPDSQQTIGQLFGIYRYSPYGLNYYSLFLFIIYVLSLNNKKINIFDGTVLMTKQQFIDNYLQSDRKMLENLLKLRVVIKTQTDDEALTDLIKNIKQLVYTERCLEYSKQLKMLVETSENTDSIKGDIAACEMKLQQGVNYNTAKYGSLTKAEKAIEQCKATFNLIQIVSVLTNLEKPEIDSKIEEYSEYLYSPIYVTRAEKILVEATKVLDENFSPFVSKLKCAYSQSSEFKKKYQQTAKRLQELGKKEYANILRSRIEAVLQEAELEQKYAATIADARRFISAIDNSVHTFDIPKCEEIAAQLLGWLDTFSAADDMVSSVREKFIRNLHETQDKVDTQKSQLDKYIQQILKEINEPSESLSLMSERITKAIRLNPDEETVITLTNTQNLIEEFNRVKASIIQADNSIIESLEEEYNSKWKGTVCDRYMAEYITYLKGIQTQKRNEWLRKNILNIRESIESMTVSQCVQWRGTKSELPDFLTDEDLEAINALSVLITEKIKTQKINGVVEMFTALSEDEKRECMRRLQELGTPKNFV